MMIKRVMFGMIVILGMFGAGGCQVYVNVPSQKYDVARNNPNISDVRQCEKLAVKAIAKGWEFDGEGVVEVELPSNTLAYTYRQVLEGLGERFVAVGSKNLNEVNGVSARFNKKQALLNANNAKGRVKVISHKEGADRAEVDAARDKADKTTEAYTKLNADIAAVVAVSKLGPAVGLLEVKQVAIRGWRATVDVERTIGGVTQFNSVRLKYRAIGGWYVDKVDGMYLGQ